MKEEKFKRAKELEELISDFERDIRDIMSASYIEIRCPGAGRPLVCPFGNIYIKMSPEELFSYKKELIIRAFNREVLKLKQQFDEL